MSKAQLRVIFVISSRLFVFRPFLLNAAQAFCLVIHIFD